MFRAVAILVCLALVAWLLPVRWTYPVHYALRYRVSVDRVTIDSKPGDCDWMRAPLGNKGCRYEAEAIVYNADGEVRSPGEKPRFVEVHWRKVEEED